MAYFTQQYSDMFLFNSEKNQMYNLYLFSGIIAVCIKHGSRGKVYEICLLTFLKLHL